MQIDQYTAVEIEEYKNTYQLKEGWMNKNGEFKPNFCKREVGPKDNKQEKLMPVTVRIGDKAKMIEVGLWILKEATGKDYAPVDMPQDDEPF